MSTETATADHGTAPASTPRATAEVRLVPTLLPRPPQPRRPPRDERPARAAPHDGTHAPVVERLGGARLASYRHPAPADGPARTAEATAGGTTRTGGSPHLDPRQACCMVAVAAVEVLAGRRPLAQLARWLTPEVYDGLARRAALTAPGTRVLDPAAHRGDLGDPRRTEEERAAATRRPSVRRVRACRIDRDVVEASVVVAHADRVRAVAVRLTRTSGWWRASALVVG
ncbi:Rv3235 family protein [Cellulomonas sp. Marseille-Q8402]